MSKDQYIVCAKVGSIPYVVPGAIEGRCQRCQAHVWVSPSSMPLLHEWTLLCAHCATGQATQEIADGKQPVVLPLTSEQLTEIEAAFKDI